MPSRPLTPADLYAMGDYIMEHGFSPFYQRGNCGCFLHAADNIKGALTLRPIVDSVYDAILRPVIGCGYYFRELSESGWTEGCTEDAAAACYIAGDILACEQARRTR